MSDNIAQMSRLDTLEGKIVGREDDCPIIEYGNGQLKKVSKLGRMVAPSKQTVQQIHDRQIQRWERKP